MEFGGNVFFIVFNDVDIEIVVKGVVIFLYLLILLWCDIFIKDNVLEKFLSVLLLLEFYVVCEFCVKCGCSCMVNIEI